MVFMPVSVGPISKNTPQTILKNNQTSETPAEVPIIEEPTPNINNLIGNLSSNDSSIRLDAVKKLIESNDPEVFNSLIKCLLNGTVTARSCAASILGNLGNPIAIKPLTLTLTFSNSTLYQYAANALSKLLLNTEADPKDIEYATRLLVIGLSRNEVEIRKCAALVLGTLGKKEANEVLIECLGDGDSDIRYTAKELLLKNNDEKIISLLAKCLVSNESAKVRMNAAWLVGELGSMDTKSITPEIADTLIAKCLEDNDVFVRVYIAEALGKIGNKKAVDSLIKCLDDKHPSPRRFAAEALGRIGDPKAIPHLVKCLENNDPKTRLDNLEDSHEISWYCAHALDTISSPSMVGLLVNCLLNEDPIVRLRSVETLVNSIEHPRVALALPNTSIDPIIKCLDDSDKDVREWSIILLGKIGNKKAVDPLVKCLDDENSSIRRYAASALGRIGDPRAIDPLIKCLNNEDNHKEDSRKVSFTLVHALVNIKDPSIVEHLVNSLFNINHPEVRLFISKTLAELEDQRMIPPLVKGFTNDDPWVRKCAAEALDHTPPQILAVGLDECLESSDEVISKNAKFFLEVLKGKTEIKVASFQELLQFSPSSS